MSTIASPLPSTTGAAAQTSSGATASTDPLANESTFLTLLVSQLQNQDPLDPVDSNQFITQLTGYSQLEQLIGIHSDTTTLSQSVDPTQAGTPTATGDSTTGAASGANQANSTTGVN